jgi:hypothetical protein
VWNQVPAQAVRDVRRRLFATWGLPGWLRLDNGLPWGGWNDLPTALALWRVGLGVALHVNPPRQPQHNGGVEKSQDTGQRWCAPHACRSAAALQGGVGLMDRIQREEYPSLQGRSRLAVSPGLKHSGRGYSRAWGDVSWSLERAEEYLGGHLAVRRANQQGQVSVYNRRCWVGAAHRGEPVVVPYAAGEQLWLLRDTAGRLLRQVAAPEICRERILALEISAR